MFSGAFLLGTRFVWFFFLFISFWPWEKDTDQLKKTSLAIPKDPSLLQTVRVALFYEKPKVSIGTKSPYEIQGLPGRKPLTQGSTLALTPVRPDASGIRLGPALYPVSGLRITSRTKEVEIENRKYHNVIEVLKNPVGSLTVVNEIDVEDYLKGVLPSEMKPTWPREALKAQAVISRTYAIYENIENKDFPFSLGSDVGTQVYGGKLVEHPDASRAVQETRGQILIHRGKIFPAFFHSTCGGMTTRADYQWRVQAHPSLRGVECPFCAGSDYYAWKAEFSSSEIRNRLARKGKRVGGIKKITLDEIDLSGRPRFFVVKHEGGSLKIPANDFRVALGPDRLRSTRVRVEEKGDSFLFRGRGWGHGVGLCQYGAKHLAELGYRYADILRYYYPDSEIRNLEEFRSLAAGSLPSGVEAREGNWVKSWFGKVKSYIDDL